MRLNACLLIMLFVSSILHSCHKPKDDEPMNAERTYTLGLDFQTDYQNDLVRVEIDGIKLLEQTVSTIHVLGLASSSKVSLKQGEHSLSIYFNGKELIQQKIVLYNNLYLGIEFDKVAQLAALNSSTIPFAYE